MSATTTTFAEDTCYDTIHVKLDPKTQPPLGSVLLKVVQSAFGGDLTALSVPAELLSGYSLLESIALTFETESIIDANKQQDPVQRMLRVAQSVIRGCSTFLYTGSLMRVKPYNSILGEHFHCFFKHANSTTQFHAEQVSHHPPVSSFYAHNCIEQFEFDATVQYAASLGFNKIFNSLVGEMGLKLNKWKERYVISTPALCGKNVLFGEPAVEWLGDLNISCAKSNCKLTIKYSDGNYVTGQVTLDNKVVCKLSGNYRSTITAQLVQTSPPQNMTLFTYSPLKQTPFTVTPLAQQQANESRRAWHDCTKHLVKGNFEQANAAKHKIEERERAIRKERVEKNTPFVPKYFKSADRKSNGVQVFEFVSSNLVDLAQNAVCEDDLN